MNIKEKLIQYIKESGKSQNKISQEVGLSASTLSMYMAGTYSGNIQNIEEKIEQYFSLMEKAESVERLPDYVETSISETVYKSIMLCHVSRGMGVFVGDAGIGKTKGAKKYLEDYNQAVMITATRACKGLKDIYRMIARALRVDGNMRLPDMEIAIKSKLFGSNRIIIIDEAQHLPITSLDGVRALNDPDDNINGDPVGIFFIGNKELWNKICGTQALDQVRNRVMLPWIMETSDIKLEDMKKLFPAYAEADMERELQYLYAIARSKWAIRGATYLFRNAKQNGDISLNGLKSIAARMGINDKI